MLDYRFVLFLFAFLANGHSEIGSQKQFCILTAFHSPEAKHDLIVTEMGVVVNGQDGLRFYGIPGEEAVVQTVLFSPHHLQEKKGRGGEGEWGRAVESFLDFQVKVFTAHRKTSM